MAERFFTEWLKLEEVKSFDSLKDDARYKAFAASDMPTSSLRQSMIDDVVGMANHYTWTEPSGLRAMLQSNVSFARSNDLAKIYGVTAWNGTDTPPTVANRPGLLTRGAFLASASGDTRPIMKGVFIRQSILCDEIPAPPKGAGATPPNLSTEMTTRQVVETITEEKGTVCAGCHKALINPLGFATEGYDALGRQRTMQKLFDQKGTLTKELPVDTNSVPNLVDGDTSVSSGPADLARLIVDSGKADACMARQYFRYTFARWENEQSDGCALEQLRKAVAGSGTMKDLVRQVSLEPAFKQRTFE